MNAFENALESLDSILFDEIFLDPYNILQYTHKSKLAHKSIHGKLRKITKIEVENKIRRDIDHVFFSGRVF